MIEFINGRLVDKGPTHAIIEVGGLAYRIQISLNTFESLPETGNDLKLVTYLHVREDAIQLFGFFDDRERDVFLGLISVSGIGPRLAQTILSGIKVTELVSAIAGEQTERLTRISGIGKKTAQRLVVELKEKFTGMGLLEDVHTSPQAPALSYMEEEALMALMALGYKRPAAEKALQRVRKTAEAKTIEELIKLTLQAI